MAGSSYAVIQFDDEGGNGLAVIHTKWLTPRKTEVFWPPYRDANSFNKALKQGEEIDEDRWKIFAIKRKFFETDDLEKANKKLKVAEETSDLNSSFSSDIETETRKRLKKKPSRYIEYDSEEEGDDNTSKFQRPEKYKLQFGLDKNQCLSTSQSKNNQSQSASWSSTSSEQLTLTSNNNCNCQAEYRSLLNEICTIKEQNLEILNYLKNSSSPSRVSTKTLPELPVKLPNTNFQDVEKLEHFLKNEHQQIALSTYLSSLGGTSVAQRTNKILKLLLDDSLACKINFIGSRNTETKKAFCYFTNLKKVVVDSVRLGDPDITEKLAEDAIKVWLKHASDRLKRKRRAETQ